MIANRAADVGQALLVCLGVRFDNGQRIAFRMYCLIYCQAAIIADAPMRIVIADPFFIHVSMSATWIVVAKCKALVVGIAPMSSKRLARDAKPMFAALHFGIGFTACQAKLTGVAVGIPIEAVIALTADEVLRSRCFGSFSLTISAKRYVFRAEAMLAMLPAVLTLAASLA